MGFRFRKSKSAGPFRFTLGKKSFSSSVGGKIFRIGINSKGKVRMTSRIPGTGVSFSTSFGGKSGRRKSGRRKKQSRFFMPRMRLPKGSIMAVPIVAAAAAVAGLITGMIMSESIAAKIFCGLVLAAIIYLVISAIYNTFFASPESEKEQEIVSNDEYWFCPKCDYKNSIKNIYCKSCNYKYDAHKAPKAAIPQVKEWQCPECGATNPENSRYCKACSASRG